MGAGGTLLHAPWLKAACGAGGQPAAVAVETACRRRRRWPQADHAAGWASGQKVWFQVEGRQLCDLLWGGFVVGWGAVGDGGDRGVDQLQPVIAMLAGGLVGKAGFEQGAEEEIAGAVAGEHPAGAVGAVGGGGQADEQQPRIGRAEIGNGLPQYCLIVKRARFCSAISPQ